MMHKNLHVVPWGAAWAVEVEGSGKPLTTHPTEQEAIDVGRKEARKRACKLKVQAADGTIRDADSYGTEPNP